MRGRGRSGGPAAPGRRKIFTRQAEKHALRPAEEPKLDPRSPEGAWYARALAAGMRDLPEAWDSLAPGPVADSIAAIAPDVRETVARLHCLARQSLPLSDAISHISLSSLAAEKIRLQRALKTAGPELRDSLEQACASIREQEAVHTRLSATRDRLLIRLQAGALGLESLVARVVELSALDGSASVTPIIAGLSDRLEGLRQGITETEEATRRALGS
jgi:hypothetical protein